MGDGGGAILVLGLIAVAGIAIWKRCDLFPDMCKPAAGSGGGVSPAPGVLTGGTHPHVRHPHIPSTSSKKDSCGCADNQIATTTIGSDGKIHCGPCSAPLAAYSRSRFTRIAI